MSDDRVFHSELAEHRRRNLAGISAISFPKNILRAQSNRRQNRQINKRRTNDDFIAFLYFYLTHGTSQINGFFAIRDIRLPISDDQSHTLILFKNLAASSGVMEEISIPVPISNPAQVEVFGKISMC